LSTSTLSSFRELPLSTPLHAALQAAGLHTPTPIQAAAIPPALAGQDIIGTAQTGTGKTAAFLVPIIERLRAAHAAGTRSVALVLAPTRELAEQIHGWALRLGGSLRPAVIVGGVAYGPQIQALRNRPGVIVATPGRLVDLLDRGAVNLRDVAILVLDEADRMLDMGFKPQLDRILRAVPAERQTMLFSATLPAELTALVRTHVRNPVRLDVGQLATPPSRTTQDVYLVRPDDKTPLLLSVLDEHPGTVLVFARTKHRTDRLTRALQHAGHAAQRLHANRTQAQRREALEGFRGGRYRVLIATDIAARGIDVTGIGRVINYDLPQTVEDYVHRIGRTARAGSHGHASSFAGPDERGQLRAIERHLGKELPRRAAMVARVGDTPTAPQHPSTRPGTAAPRQVAQEPTENRGRRPFGRPQRPFNQRRREAAYGRPRRPRDRFDVAAEQ